MPVAKQSQAKYNLKEYPEPLRPYVFHGLTLGPPNSSEKERVTDCPFCKREGKFFVNSETGLWTCKVCGGDQEKGGGNIFNFLRKLYEVSDQQTGSKDYEALAKQRGLEFAETVMVWGLAKSVINGLWLFPGYHHDPKGGLVLKNLYLYAKVKEGKHALLSTPGCSHTLFGLTLYDQKKPDVFLNEGPWCSMKLFEALKRSKLNDATGELVATSSQEACLLASVNVLAAPGCNSFSEYWTRWFKGKNVSLFYDSDHPKTLESGAVIPPAGTTGMERVSGYIGEVADNLSYLHWGKDGYDPNLPSGYDVRDTLMEKGQLEGLTFLSERLQEVPEEWRKELDKVDSSLQCVPCDNWKTLITAWRKALKWTDGLAHGLASMLAVVASTKSVGDQLWMKIISPASSGKSTLSEAISVNKEYVIAKSTIRGFHSGYKSDTAGTEDNSLLKLVNNKCLMTKDGDTLLQSPNLSQILSEARDVYDGMSRTHYRNQMGKDYENLRMTWCLCGTNSLRFLDSSELGARFLDCVIMDQIDEELEDDILWRVVNRAADHVSLEAGAEGEEGVLHSPEMRAAMELTGGYVSWLRENAYDKLPTIEFDEEAKRACIHFGKFVAYMRARPSKLQNEKAERELAARLVSQHTRYAKCLAYVINESSVNSRVLRQVRRVCLDTARGVVFDIAESLYPAGIAGKEVKAIALQVNLGDAELRKMLRFLKEIRVVEVVKVNNRVVWRLTKPLTRLYREVVNYEQAERQA